MDGQDLQWTISLALMWLCLGSFTTALALQVVGDSHLWLLLFQLLPIAWMNVTRNTAIAVFYSVGILFVGLSTVISQG